VDRGDVWEVALVVLDDVGDLVDRDVLLGEVFLEIAKTLDVFLHLFPLRVSHKNDAIHAPQHELAGGVLKHLAPDPIKLEICTEALFTPSG